MKYQIIDNTDCVRFVTDGRIFFLPKKAVTGIEVIRDGVIKICRANCESSIYIKHHDVTYPYAATPTDLTIIINSWVSNLPIPPRND